MMQIEINEQTVDRQLVDAGIGKDAEEQALAAEREAANARREQELAASKAGAVSYEEYLNLKH